MTAPIPTAPAAPQPSGQVPAGQPAQPQQPPPQAPAGQVPAPQPPVVPQPYQQPPQPPVYQPPAAPAAPQYQPPWQPPQPAGQEPAGDGGRDLSALPQWAQQQIQELRQESAQRRVAARSAIVNQHAFAAAASLGVDGHALIGSAAFQQISGSLDPSAADFGQQLAAKVSELRAANPWMAAQQQAPIVPQVPAASGGDFPGGTGAGVPITQEQLAAMSPEQVAKLYGEGKLSHLL
jgi:hypothetical protein